MKKAFIIISVIILILVAAWAIGFTVYVHTGEIDLGEITLKDIPQKDDDATRVMSFNLRCTNDENGQTITNRSKIAIEVVNQYLPDSFGVQESTLRWQLIFKHKLGDKYASVGKARDYYGPFSEYCSVYYLKDKYNLIDSDTFWLSETPEKKYTKSFGSQCYRIATWAILEDKQTGQRYAHFNTHLDHGTDETRAGQIRIVIDKFNELKKEMPVVCTGDFNTYEDSAAYALMCESALDAKVIAENSDDGPTFTKYDTKTSGYGKGAIDFIFLSDDIEADTYKIIRDSIKGIYPSDHFPIMADVEFSDD